MAGLYCYPLTAGGGTCTANAGAAQPPQDGSFPDGGQAPTLPALTDAETSPTDSAPDTAPTTLSSDADTSEEMSSPTDAGAQDASSSE
jgi:hypothetical protein